jgi:hypothetical protein
MPNFVGKQLILIVVSREEKDLHTQLNLLIMDKERKKKEEINKKQQFNRSQQNKIRELNFIFVLEEY